MRKIMKKTVALILIFVMIFSVSGCKRADFEDTALPFDTADEGTSENEKTPENETPQPEIQKPKGDKAEPCSLTLENAFSEYEVIVTLTKEETAKNKTYTEKDFADYDIFYVLENDEYYGNPNMKDSYPEYQGRTTLFLYLNSPSKENVLKTVKNLEKDKRVFAACPNPFEFDGRIKITYTYSNYEQDRINKLKNICNLLEKKNLSNYYAFGNSIVYVDVSESTIEETIRIISELESECLSADIKPNYPYVASTRLLVEMSSAKKEYTLDDFPYLELEKIESVPNYSNNGRMHLILYLKNKTMQSIADAVKALNEDSKVINVTLEQNNLTNT